MFSPVLHPAIIKLDQATDNRLVTVKTQQEVGVF